jgi:hypothetical protein
MSIDQDSELIVIPDRLHPLDRMPSLISRSRFRQGPPPAAAPRRRDRAVLDQIGTSKNNPVVRSMADCDRAKPYFAAVFSWRDPMGAM